MPRKLNIILLLIVVGLLLILLKPSTSLVVPTSMAKWASLPFKLPKQVEGVVFPELLSIYQVMGKLRTLPQDDPLKKRFSRLFETRSKQGSLVIPPAFEGKARELFASYPGGTAHLGFITNQTVVTTYNRYTEEYSMFNEVRRYRPGYQEKLSPENEHIIQQAIKEGEGADKCDFCSMERTAIDVFGRIESKHCYTASNVAKYEQWHGLIISKVHSPLIFDKDMLQDYMETAHEWYRRVNRLDPEAQFPHLMWDAGKRAAASQIHQHLQMIITQDRYLTRTEHTRAASVRFEQDYDLNYWEELIAVHEALGLAVRAGQTIVLSYITPIKEREMIIVTENSHHPSFGRAIAAALHALTDDVGCRAFSLAISFAPLDNKGNTAFGPFPAMARVVDRGSPMDTRSDVGAMEFYGANNVGADPYHIMPFLRKQVAQV
jgi:hypothetical protein